MEKEIKIKTRDGKYIHSRLRGLFEKPLLIFVHGLTGNMDEHIFFNGSRFFEKEGFSVFRFNLYDDPDDARKLHECDLKTHAADINFIVDHFKKKGVKDIFIVGHSYGGPSILFSKTDNYKGIVLWDPTMDPDVIYRKTTADKIADGYIWECSFKFILGKKMVNEAKEIPNFELLATNVNAPIKIILAGVGNAKSKRKESFFKALCKPKGLTILKKAGHTFNEDGMEEKLFQETLNWIKELGKSK